MTAKLKVTFGDPHYGWLTVRVAWGDPAVSFDASYVHNSLWDLAVALHSLLLVEGQARVVWNTEPVEYEMRFKRSGDTVHFELVEFPDYGRANVAGQTHVTLLGTYNDICRPFWRALRELQSRYSEQEFQQLMQMPFPTSEVEKLTQALKERST